MTGKKEKYTLDKVPHDGKLVEDFIYAFLHHSSKEVGACSRNVFSRKYSYCFAVFLMTVFGGSIAESDDRQVIRFAWQDDDGSLYTVLGKVDISLSSAYSTASDSARDRERAGMIRYGMLNSDIVRCGRMVCRDDRRGPMQYGVYDDDTSQQQEVLHFIGGMHAYAYRTGISIDMMHRMFMCGYCWYFAEMLKYMFGRGEACWCAPLGHFKWVDTDGNDYDAEGCAFRDCDYYIESRYLGRALDDFRHIRGRSFNADVYDIENIISRWKEDKGMH